MNIPVMESKEHIVDEYTDEHKKLFRECARCANERGDCIKMTVTGVRLCYDCYDIYLDVAQLFDNAFRSELWMKDYGDYRLIFRKKNNESIDNDNEE